VNPPGGLFDSHRERAVRYAHTLARRYTPLAERDDVTQIGLIGCWRAATSWTGAGAFPAVLWACVRNELVDEARRTRWTRGGRHDPAAWDLPDRFDPSDRHVPTVEAGYAAAETAADLQAALEQLPDLDRSIVMACAAGESQSSVARRIGMSPSRVGQIRQQALTVLARQLRGD
jgi:RNA polymerase sigma factor (sigma-70 family)